MDGFNWLKTGTLTKAIIVTDKLKYHEGRADNKRQIFVVFFWDEAKVSYGFYYLLSSYS